MKHDQLTMLGGALKGMRLRSVEDTQMAPGSLAIVYGRLSYSDSERAWVEVADFTPDLYGFNTFTFTAAGRTGNVGPTLAQCRSYYGTSLAWLSNTAFFNVTSGTQIWTVPITGKYRIELVGGRMNVANSVTGRVTAELTLVKGEKIRIVVGQTSATASGTFPAMCGCGGTAVYLEEGSIPLVVAGGAGGYAESQASRPGATIVTSHTTGTAGTNRIDRDSTGRAVVSSQGGAGFDNPCAAIAVPPTTINQAQTPVATGALKLIATGGRSYNVQANSDSNNVASNNGYGGFGGGGSGHYTSWWQGNNPRSKTYGCGGGGGYVGGTAGGWSTDTYNQVVIQAACGFAGRNFVNTQIRNASVVSSEYLASGTAQAKFTLIQ